MSDPETLPIHVHQEAALLPWYANGTLSESDRQHIDRHLATCPTCQAELEELTNLKSDLVSFYAAQPGLSPQASRRVLDTVRREASTRRIGQSGRQPWLERLDQEFRSFLLPRWVPTLAVVLLVAQAGSLLWLSTSLTNQQQVSSRSLASQTARFALAFQSGATEEGIRSLLQLVHGRVIDGPRADGTYMIEVLAEDESITQTKMELLRKRTDIVRSADSVKP